MMRNAFLAAAMLVSLCFASAAAAQQAEKPSEAAVPAAPAAGSRPHITYLDKSKVIYILYPIKGD